MEPPLGERWALVTNGRGGFKLRHWCGQMSGWVENTSVMEEKEAALLCARLNFIELKLVEDIIKGPWTPVE